MRCLWVFLGCVRLRGTLLLQLLRRRAVNASKQRVGRMTDFLFSLNILDVNRRALRSPMYLAEADRYIYISVGVHSHI